MVRNRDSLMGRNLGLEDQVTTFLMDYAVTPIAAQCFCEITDFKIPRQLHAYARTSSRTMCSRRVVGSLSGCSKQKALTTSLTFCQRSSHVSPSVTMVSVRHSAQ